VFLTYLYIVNCVAFVSFVWMQVNNLKTIVSRFPCVRGYDCNKQESELCVRGYDCKCALGATIWGNCPHCLSNFGIENILTVFISSDHWTFDPNVWWCYHWFEHLFAQTTVRLLCAKILSNFICFMILIRYTFINSWILRCGPLSTALWEVVDTVDLIGMPT